MAKFIKSSNEFEDQRVNLDFILCYAPLYGCTSDNSKLSQIFFYSQNADGSLSEEPCITWTYHDAEEMESDLERLDNLLCEE